MSLNNLKINKTKAKELYINASGSVYGKHWCYTQPQHSSGSLSGVLGPGEAGRANPPPVDFQLIVEASTIIATATTAPERAG